LPQYTTCTAYYNGQPIAGATDLLIRSGSVTDTSAPGVRRTMDLELVPTPGLFDLLSPVGVQLRPISVTKYNNSEAELIPMGVFDLTAVSKSYGADGTIKLSCFDKWVLVQRASFVTPYASQPTLTVAQQIAALIRYALGQGENVNVLATSQALVGSLVWDDKVDDAINKMAESIGAWAYFDRNGVATVADLPTLTSTSAAWSVDASASGVLLDADRSKDRSKTYNMVVVNSEKADGGALFDPQIVSDTDPNSPTYVGGPFGQVPYKYSSPLLTNATQALQAGAAKLATLTGLNSQLSLTAVRNHALDALDAIDVQLPRERYDVSIPSERHLIDKVVHPLMPDGTQQIDTRATRTDTV
jgi:hypothetical protein